MKKTYLMAILLIILFLAAGCIKNNIQNHKTTPIQIKISQNSAEGNYKPSETWFNAKITIDGSKSAGEINELIYGNNGWIDNMKLNFPAFPGKNKAEFYNEQMNRFYYYFDIINDMKPTIIRLPGGLQANHEDWKKVIGDFEKRPESTESGVKQIVAAGLDEHIEAAENIGSEIIYTVNFADSKEKSAELARYLKGKARYYELGNELNCGMKKNDVLIKKVAEEYAKKLALVSDAMKSADPSIKIGSIDDCNKLGKDWYDTVYEIAGNKFDFWAKHAYSPGSDGNVKGVTINNAKLSLKTKHDFKYDGDYELVFLAEGKKQFNNIPGFDILIDGNKIGSITIDEFSGIFRNEPAAKFYRLNANIKKGQHYFEIISSDAVENNAFLVLHPIIKITNNEEDDVIDLRNDENIIKLIASGAAAIGEKLEEDRDLFHEKPVFITEWNTIYSFDECSKKGILSNEKIMCSRNNGITSIRNLWIRHDGKEYKNDVRPAPIELDSLAHPDYDIESQLILENSKLIPFEERHLGGMIFFQTQRGCPLACSYCTNHIMHELYKGKSPILRSHSVDYVIEELSRLKNKFKSIKVFDIRDETFLVRPLPWIREFSEKYKKNVYIRFKCLAEPASMSAGDMSEEKIRLLVDAGLTDIIIGIQSGSDNINFSIYKRYIKSDQVIRCAEVVNKFKDRLAVMYDIMTCNPYEEKDDVLASIKLIMKLPKPFYLSVNNLIFFEGTPLHERASRDNIIRDGRDSASDLNYWDRWKHIKLKKKNAYLNLVLNLMRGKVTDKRYGLIPAKLLSMLISEKSVSFNYNHLIITRLAGNFVQAADYARENIAKPLYRSMPVSVKLWYDKVRYKA